MRVLPIVLLLVCLGACTRETPRIEAQGGAQTQPASTEAAVTVEPAPTTPEPVEPTPAHDPTEAAETSASTPANRWAEGTIAAPSRAKPPPTSVLGRLPKAEAIALVVSDEKLELVAAQPSGWRLELAKGRLRHIQFEPATGLVFFYRQDSVWAIDLLEPLAAEAVAPPVVELARRSKDNIALTPGEVILCVPPVGKERFRSCWPHEPLPTNTEWVPEYLAIDWDDPPSATWQVPLSDLDVDEGEDGEEARHVSLDMVGAEWLRARADRRQHFELVRGSVHGFYAAEPMANPPALAGRCLDEEDCGKSLPLGMSGWEWVVVGSSQGDLFHPDFAVHNPATKRWAKWEQLLANEAAWVPTSELERRADELSDETYPLFDGGGRVFASTSREQLCWFRFDGQAEVATAVSCESAGGTVVGFLSVPSYLGQWCSYC